MNPFKPGQRVIGTCDIPQHGDYSFNGRAGTVISCTDDSDEDRTRWEVSVVDALGRRYRVLSTSVKACDCQEDAYCSDACEDAEADEMAQEQAFWRA